MPANNGPPFVLLASFFNRDSVPSFPLFAFGMVEAIVRFRIILLICTHENIIIATPPITPIILKPSSSTIINEKLISPCEIIRVYGSSMIVCPKAILMSERTPSLLP
jgi:hypothetical protein